MHVLNIVAVDVKKIKNEGFFFYYLLKIINSIFLNFSLNVL